GMANALHDVVALLGMQHVPQGQRYALRLVAAVGLPPAHQARTVAERIALRRRLDQFGKCKRPSHLPSRSTAKGNSPRTKVRNWLSTVKSRTAFVLLRQTA